MESHFSCALALIVQLIIAVAIGYLAARKNRNGWGWGLMAFLFCIPTVIFLMFMPYLCPVCKRPLTNQEWRSGVCPSCGGVSKMSQDWS